MKSFEKVFVKSGSENVTILLPTKEMTYSDVTKKSWVVKLVAYNIKTENLPRDIMEKTTINIDI